MSQKQHVKIWNPAPEGRTHVSLNRAKRFVAEGVAKFDGVGRLVLLYDSATTLRKLNAKGPLGINIVPQFCGLDAFPGRAIMPPSPSVLRQMRSYRGPLVPPLSSQQQQQ